MLRWREPAGARMSVPRRFLVCLSILVGAGLCLAAPAAAHTTVDSQAYWYHWNGSDDGVRAYIAGSGYASGWGFILTSVQTINLIADPSPGMLQIGETQSSGGYAWSCFPSGASGTKVFVEYHIYGAGTYECPVLNSEPGFGDGHLFAVKHSSGYWHALEDGNSLWSSGNGIDLNFSTGHSVAFAEAVFDPSPSYSLPAEAITFGPLHQIGYSFTTDHGVSWTDVSNSCPSCYNNLDTDFDWDLNNDNDWNLYALPSPFNINFDRGNYRS
jgi:hypothetical protein